jgi:hypothetical protein
MVEALRKSLAPLLLAGALAALAGCSSYDSGTTSASNVSPCAVGPAAQQHPACDTRQDQSETRSRF